MEPITASVAVSDPSQVDPNEDDATSFVFGNGNTADGGANSNPTQTPTATAATSTGSGAATAVANPVPSAVVLSSPASTAQTGSSLSLTTILLLAGGVFLVLHVLKR